MARRDRRATEVELQLRQLFASAGCDGFLHACEVEGGAFVDLDGDTPVISASVFKVVVALEFFRQTTAGTLDPAERVRLEPRASLGAPSGLALFSDDVEVSLRDLALSMLTVSDSLATDVLIDRVGLVEINALARSLGLTQTVIAMNVAQMADSLARDVGFDGWRELAAHQWVDEEELASAVERMRAARVCDPTRDEATRTTARETARLLSLIWRDEAAPAEACASVRELMAKQLQQERVARAFKNDPAVRFSGKTGSFGGRFRNEAGVFEFPDGGRYAVAVFTAAHNLYTRPLDIDDAIGEAARIAVTALRQRG